MRQITHVLREIAQWVILFRSAWPGSHALEQDMNHTQV